jgi:hypothetical protein
MQAACKGRIMSAKKQKYLIGALLLVAGIAIDMEKTVAPAAPGLKIYTLADLRRSVTNSEQCKPFYNDLKQLTKKPIKLQFSQNPDNENDVTANDLSGQIKNYTHTMVKQTVSGGAVNRVGMGTFEFKKQKIDYVIEVSGNIDHSNHHYLYPIILASHNAHCYYTALLKPDDETAEAFKQSIRSGAVAKKTDLVK